MDARSLVLADHARVHAAAVAQAEGLNLEDLICSGLTPEQMQTRPPGHSSIAWFLWHMARTEDVAVNVVLRGTAQVLERGGWREQIAVRGVDIGTGMSDDEVDAFSRAVAPATVCAYRAAVGRETQTWLAGLDIATLDDVIDTAADAVRAAGAFGENAGWVGPFWTGKTRGWFLSWVVIGHNYMHLAEAAHGGRMLGRPGR